MNYIIHRANERGISKFDWLLSAHTFSFGHYYDASRMGFGVLRVINDDIVKPAAGFDTHHHENMEIISIPIFGTLNHRDSEGHIQSVSAGEIQLMSAGAGISHSEFNGSNDQDVNFLQIWVQPKVKNSKPSYQQSSFNWDAMTNQFCCLISPEGDGLGSISIKQDAYLSLALVNQNKQIEYKLHHGGNGIYLFVIDGAVTLSDEKLTKRDGMAMFDLEQISIQSNAQSKLMIIEAPL